MGSIPIFLAVLEAAVTAWSAIQAARDDPQAVLTALAQYVDAVQVALDDTVTSGLRPTALQLAKLAGATLTVVRSLRDAVNRTAGWTWAFMIVPVRFALNAKINQAVAFFLLRLAALRADLVSQILAVRLFAALLFHTEQQARIKDVLAARKYAADLTAALHQAIEREAASGYSAGKGDRLGPLSQLVAELHLRGLVDDVVNKLLVDAVKVLAEVEDPALAAVVSRVIGAVIKKSGIGGDLGNYLYGLIVPGQGGPDPKDLPSVVSDVSHRLGAIEDWITGFMLAGGPEVKDAGRQWKTVTSLTVDAALVAFLAQAVVAPNAWAREVADTVGVVANDSIGGIVDLISRV